MSSSSNLSKFCRTKLWVQSSTAATNEKMKNSNLHLFSMADDQKTSANQNFVLSPVSDLVFHLNNQSLEGTPRRRLSLDTVSSSGTPSTTPDKIFEKKTKIFADFALDTLTENDDALDAEIPREGVLTEISPGRQARMRLVDRRSVNFDDDDDESLSPNSLEQNKENLRAPLIKVTGLHHTSTSSCLDLEELRSPVLISPTPSSVFLDEDSQDSAYSGSQSSRKASSIEDTFLAPCAPPPHRSRQKSNVNSPSIKRSRDEDDDGFMDEFVELQTENDDPMGGCDHLDVLLQGTLLASSPANRPVSYSCLDETPVKRKSGLESVLLVNFTGGIGLKRPSSISDENNYQDENFMPDMKRRKSVAETAFTSLKVPNPIHMHRCRSESEVVHALQRVDENCALIGDFSNNHILPLISSPKVADLNCINGQTVCELLDQRYRNVIDRFTVIDCRYPYEYEGGHIRGAVNIYEKEKLEEFLSSDKFLSRKIYGDEQNSALDDQFSAEKRNVLLFYCEFSKERGPKMSRFLRAQDRKRNEYRYPKLDYPEIYLLEGGYKSFFENFQPYCDPQRYKPMTHRDHVDDLRKFRIKSKSWSSFGAVENGGGHAPATRRPGLNRGLFS